MIANKKKQIEAMRRAALAKRTFAAKLNEEAEEDLIQANILEKDLEVEREDQT